MSQHTVSTESSTTDTGRETNGRFAGGNTCGTGNPFARQVADLRVAMVASVTEEDIQAITVRLVQEARDGDKTATKLLFQYVIGKPPPAVDPDRLAVDEMRSLNESAIAPEVVASIMQRLPVEFALGLARLGLEAAAANHGALLADLLKQDESADAAAEDAEPAQHQTETTEPQPSTNGNYGTADVVDEANPPSTNGDNGHEVMAALFDWLRGHRGASDGDPRT